MDATHPLKALLNVHLASDASAVTHLPYIVDLLCAEQFSPSPHLPKWTARLNSLLHSKDNGARWAGLCLAYKTSLYSKSTLLECAQSWLSIAIPILSKKEPLPTLIASINLCRTVFSSAKEVPEFQRQVCTPNVPKFTAALIILLDKESDLQLQGLILKTIAKLVPIYPNIHRASHAALSSIVLRIFSESAPIHSSQSLIEPACCLYSVLHHTGGKVGAANLWRISLDESIGSAWTAFTGVRTTFPDENGRFPQVQQLHEEPTTSVTFSMERLCTSIQATCSLLRTPTQRPVQVPVGSLTRLASKLILVTVENETSPGVDPIVRVIETAFIPRIWKAGCELIQCLCKCIGRHLTPYSSRLLSYLAFHLEQKLPPIQRVPFLETAYALLTHCHPCHSSVLCSRLTRIALSGLLVVLPRQIDVQHGIETNGTIRSKKGKKKARNYEGDELFRTSGDVLCPSIDDAKALLITCDILQSLLQSTDVSASLQSMASRIILAVLLELPQMIPSTLSPHIQVYHTLLNKIRQAAIQLGSGATSAMSESLNLVLTAASSTEIERGSLSKVDMLIHPRLPPLQRTLPKIGSLTLFRSEESAEEVEERQRLGLEASQEPTITDDVIMEDTSNTHISAPTSLIEKPTDNGASHLPSSLMPQARSTIRAEQHISPGNAPSSSMSKSANAPNLHTHPSQATGSTHTSKIAASESLDVDEEMPSINLDSDSDSD
ncbi:rRNA processing/ribosome biogenesis-domain-containing protein [Lentinula raphanica]|nr:rRNA processing/ribosome biogenesis-domain-containing protein [Lentinula raphanica]